MQGRVCVSCASCEFVRVCACWYPPTPQTSLSEIRARTNALRAAKALVPWKAIPKSEVRMGLKGLEASKKYLHSVIESMRDGVSQGYASEEWW